MSKAQKPVEGQPAFDAAASRTQWLKGVLELCVLAIICQDEVYGYEIGQRLEAAGFGGIKGGTLYPRLAAMESNGLVEIEWRIGEHGPGRKYYSATPAGHRLLAEATAEYRRFGAAVGELLGFDDDTSIAASTGEHT